MAQWQPQPQIIRQKFPNQNVLLYQGFSELADKENIIEGTSSVQISWYPFPRIIIEFEYKGEDSVDLGETNLKLTELVPQEWIKVHFYESSKQGLNPYKLVGYLTQPLIQGKTEGLLSLTFHVANFYCFNNSNRYDYELDDKGIEKEIQREGWLDFDGQLIFDFEDWHIVLGTLEETYDLQEKLEVQGGYGVTHVCKVEKLDNSQFNLDKGYEIINAFVYYLSFVRGIWLAPLFVTGFDAEGNKILEEWRTPTIKADSWQSPNYSCVEADSTEIVDIFSGFMKKWQDKVWKEVVQNSIQWYLESFKHQTGYNTSIILIQAALEKIAWTYLKTNACVTSEGFNGLKASGQIRLLLKFLNIELIPVDSDNYPKIKFKANERKETWIDTVQAFTEVRNAIIHPPAKKGEKPFLPSEEMMIEAFAIGHHYLLQCLLKLFDRPYI